jgi:hypothetical protein
MAEIAGEVFAGRFGGGEDTDGDKCGDGEKMRAQKPHEVRAAAGF